MAGLPFSPRVRAAWVSSTHRLQGWFMVDSCLFHQMKQPRSHWVPVFCVSQYLLHSFLPLYSAASAAAWKPPPPASGLLPSSTPGRYYRHLGPTLRQFLSLQDRLRDQTLVNFSQVGSFSMAAVTNQHISTVAITSMVAWKNADLCSHSSGQKEFHGAEIKVLSLWKF